jgi:hypothetical protein
MKNVQREEVQNRFVNLALVKMRIGNPNNANNAIGLGIGTAIPLCRLKSRMSSACATLVTRSSKLDGLGPSERKKVALHRGNRGQGRNKGKPSRRSYILTARFP